MARTLYCSPSESLRGQSIDQDECEQGDAQCVGDFKSEK